MITSQNPLREFHFDFSFIKIIYFLLSIHTKSRWLSVNTVLRYSSNVFVYFNYLKSFIYMFIYTCIKVVISK